MTRRPTAVVAVLQVAVFVAVLGLPDGGLGVLWPSMRATFARPVGDLGVLVLAITVPYLAAGLVSGRVVRRVGYGWLVVAITAVGAAALSGWAAAPVWGLALAAAAVLGWAKGAADAGLNAYASEHEGVRRLGVLHASYGVGASLAPIAAAGVLASGGGWRPAVAGLGGVAAALLVVSLVARRWWAVPAPTVPAPAVPAPAGSAPRTADGGAGLRPGPPVAVVAAVLVVFFVYVAAEAAAGAWAFTVLTTARGMGRGAAGVAVACYWAALTLGRVLLALAGHRVVPRRVVDVGVVLALAGLVAFWVDPFGLGWLGLPVAGLAFGPVFPVLISEVPGTVGRERSARVIGWCIAAAALGGPAAIALAGMVADREGVRAVPAVLAAAGALLVAANWGAARIRGPEPDAALASPAVTGTVR